MSLIDRLRGVIRPGGPGHAGGPEGPPADECADDVLGGEWRESGGQRFLVVDRTYRPGHRHGQMAIADALPPSDGPWPGLSLLAGGSDRLRAKRSGESAEALAEAERTRPTINGPDSARPAGHAEAGGVGGRLLFVDLETTGLAGGAGTYAFLVGCGWFDGGSFRIRQFVLTSFAAERALLDAVADVAAESGTVVTYNGKSFDLPLIETRFVLHRRGTPFADMPHVDMLHPARRLWRRDDDGCRLAALEQMLCGVVREGDVPGFEIPSRYFHYVRSGDARPLEAVLEHNRLDVLSLACVTARAALLLDEGAAAARGAREALGLGRLYERGGRVHEARACFMRACTLDDDAGETRAEALKAYALVSRRLRCYEDAAAAWRRILELPECAEGIVREAAEALAVHHEHRARDLPVARALAMQSLTRSGTLARRQALQHRLARLDRKLGERSAALF